MKIGTSFSVPVVSDVRELAPSSDPIVFVVGAFAHGKVDVEYTEKMVSISNYPLSAALTCAKVTTAFEEAWGFSDSRAQSPNTVQTLLPAPVLSRLLEDPPCTQTGVCGSPGCTPAICLFYKRCSCKNK